MKVRVRIDTLTDVAAFVLAVSDVKSTVWLTSPSGVRACGQSFLGVAHAKEFKNLWCECEEDIYTKIQNFVVE
mgnify:CR=1 FL=1